MAPVKLEHTAPKIDERPEQPYMAIRTLIKPSKLANTIRDLTIEVFAWLEEHGTGVTGPPFVRYNIIDMKNQFDLTIGVLVASHVAGDGHVEPGSIPAGRYGSLIYTNARRGRAGNGTLIDWARAEGIEWDHTDGPNGDAFAARVEYALTDPADEPDIAKWLTEVAIKIAD